jgi:LPS-assembly protein
LNIAPNFDYTVALRDMTKRGKLIMNEFRFQEADSYGVINYDKMPNDHLANAPREHTTVMARENLGGGFSTTLNLNRVSDDNYFRDLSVAVGDVAQTQLLNEGVLSYSGGWLTGSVRAQTFQTIQDTLGDVAIPYQRMPQINLSAQKTLNDTSLSMVNEYVDFRHPTMVEGQRLVLYPSVTYSLLNDPGFYMKPKFGVNYTQYEMGVNNSTNIPNITRTLPIFSLDSGMTFERDMKLGEGEYVQTLEPRVYYVKIPYQNQDTIPLFDTTQAALSFPQMFSENRFYGNDQIGDANMVTTGLTTRLIDGVGGIERLNIGVAERYSLSMPQIAPDANLKSDILLSIGGKLTKSITLSSLFDYNPNEKYTTSGSVTASYKPEIGKLLNLGYNFTQDIVTPTNDTRQADISAQWPLFWHWNVVSRLSYDLQQNVTTVKLIGLEYNQSCWTLRLVAEQFWYSVTTSNNATFIQLELNDLVAVGTSNPLADLKFYIPGYTKLNDPKFNPVSTPGTVSP